MFKYVRKPFGHKNIAQTIQRITSDIRYICGKDNKIAYDRKF